MYDLFFMQPTDKEISETSALILEKLKGMPRSKNESARPGYKIAYTILKNGIRERSRIPMARLSAGTRAMALLAIDYLNGACDQDFLLNWQAATDNPRTPRLCLK